MGAQIEIVLISLSARPRIAISGVVRLRSTPTSMRAVQPITVEAFRAVLSAGLDPAAE